MDFDTLLSLASKNQQDKLGVRRPTAAISTSLPAPKRLERKQVDSSAIRRLLDEKKARSADEAASGSRNPASSASTAVPKEKVLPPTAKAEATVTARSAAVPSTSSSGGRQNPHHERQSRVGAGGGSAAPPPPASDGLGKDGSVSNGRGSSNRDTSLAKAALPGSAASSSGAGCAGSVGSGKANPVAAGSVTSGNSLASDSAQARAQSKLSTAKVVGSAGKAKTIQPSKPLNYAELMALAAAKVTDPAAAAAAAAAATATTDRVSKTPEQPTREQQKSGVRPIVPSGPAKGPTQASIGTAAQPKPRKRSSKLPPELEDLLGIRNQDQSQTDRLASSSRPGEPAGSAAKVKDAKSANGDGKSAKKPDTAGPRAPKRETGPAATADEQPPRPRSISKAQLAVAFMQKRKEAAMAEAGRSSGRLTPAEWPPHGADLGARSDGSKTARLQSETVASHSSSRGAAAQPTSRHQRPPLPGSGGAATASASAARSDRPPAVGGKLTASRDDGANLSVWDRIVGKASTAAKPKEPRKRHVLESDDEYDEDMDDFIDDGDAYAPGGDISAEIKKIFGYDRSKFKDDDDDDIAMEARFADVMKEEARSARLGRLEDLEDIRKEEEYKKAKKRKKLK